MSSKKTFLRDETVNEVVKYDVSWYKASCTEY